MMGQQLRTESLFYYFRFEDQSQRLRNFYSSTGRPSIDPEVLLLLVGYLYGITSERRLLEEVRMHLAYRWFARFDFGQEIPDHSTFSKNRHGRFRQSSVFREVFEEIVRCCLAAGLVEGENLAVDGTLVEANASRQSKVPRQRLGEAAQVSRTVPEYLAELEVANPVPETGMVSKTDPDATWAKKGGPAKMAYYDNYLMDTASRVILEVEASPALFHQETVAARKMIERVEKLGLRPKSLGADKAYGSGEFLAWLLARGVKPHIPVIDRRHQTFGHFTRDQFRYAPEENAYYYPEGKPLRYSRPNRRGQNYIYSSTVLQCRGCPQKDCCTTGPFRNLVIHWHEKAREVVRGLAGTPAYVRSQRARGKIEAMFSELKNRIGLRRVRLRRLWNVSEQFLLAATAQNLKRLVRYLTQRPPSLENQSA